MTRFTVFLILLLSARPLVAADIESELSEDGNGIIYIFGDIQEGDAQKFRNEAAKYSQGVVILASSGGSTLEAIDIGETIRVKGLSTWAVNETDCNSACGLIWLAGTPRILSESARVGFHASYTGIGQQASESGVGNALVGRYLAILNLPSQAIIFTTSAPPNRLNYVSSLNYREVGIDTLVLDDIDGIADSNTNVTDAQTTGIQASSPAAQMTYNPLSDDDETFHVDTIGNWHVRVDLTVKGGCYAFVGYEEDTLLRLSIMPQKDAVVMYLSNWRWRSMRDGQNYKLLIRFDNYEPWTVDANSLLMGDDPALSFDVTNREFFDEFSTSEVLNVSYNDQSIANLSLSNTRDVLSSLTTCQDAIEEVVDDPFAN